MVPVRTVVAVSTWTVVVNSKHILNTRIKFVGNVRGMRTRRGSCAMGCRAMACRAVACRAVACCTMARCAAAIARRAAIA
jgi:hypothetical protein